MTDLTNICEIEDLVARGAVFYCSHSGGKDSQAQYALLCDLQNHDTRPLLFQRIQLLVVLIVLVLAFSLVNPISISLG